MRYLSEFLWTHYWDVGTIVPINSEFLTLNLNISVLPRLNLLHLNTSVSLVGHLLRPLVLFSITFSPSGNENEYNHNDNCLIDVFKWSPR